MERPEKTEFKIKIIDSVKDYSELMQEQFDFTMLKKLFTRKDFNFAFDAMNGIAGPYAINIFHDLLNCAKESLKNCIPKPDFGNVIFIPFYYKLIN